jgi:hypothetical protein
MGRYDLPVVAETHREARRSKWLIVLPLANTLAVAPGRGFFGNRRCIAPMRWPRSDYPSRTSEKRRDICFGSAGDDGGKARRKSRPLTRPCGGPPNNEHGCDNRTRQHEATSAHNHSEISSSSWLER